MALRTRGRQATDMDKRCREFTGKAVVGGVKVERPVIMYIKKAQSCLKRSCT